MNDSFCILSMDIGGTFIKNALITNEGSIIGDTIMKIPIESYSNLVKCKRDFQSTIEKMRTVADEKNTKIKGVAVSIPGPFDYKAGISYMEHKYQALKGVSIRSWFKEILGDVPIRFISDSAAYLLGQISRPEVNAYSRICLITLGTGIGFGAIIDGNILSTETGSPKIVIYSRRYKDKTAEYFLGREGIIRSYLDKSKEVGSEIDVIDIARRADKKDLLAVETFEELGKMISEILNPIINEYQFEVLIIGGQIAKAYHLFQNSLVIGFADSNSIKLITAAKYIDESALIGASTLLR